MTAKMTAAEVRRGELLTVIAANPGSTARQLMSHVKGATLAKVRGDITALCDAKLAEMSGVTAHGSELFSAVSADIPVEAAAL